MSLFDDLFTDDIADEYNLRRLICLVTHCGHVIHVADLLRSEPDDNEDTVKSEQADNEVSFRGA